MGYVAALAGMLLYGVASVMQAYAAKRASGAAVLRHPGYVGGLVCDGLAWVCSVIALATMPLFLVQSLLAGSLAVTVLLAVPVLGVKPTRRDVLAIAVVTVGLVLVSASAATESTSPVPEWFPGVLMGAAVLVVVLSAALYRRGGTVALAVLAGLGFSAAALGARAAHLGEEPWLTTLENPLTWTVLVAGICGAVMYARSLERGAIGPATATLWVVEVVVPGAIGLLWLGDAVRPGWGPAALVGIAAAIAGCAALAHSPAQG